MTGRSVPSPDNYQGDAAAEISSGHPGSYFDYIERKYGEAFRAGTSDAIETFTLLYQQIAQLGNEEATNKFGERFVPMLPREARKRIVNEHLHIPQKPNKMQS